MPSIDPLSSSIYFSAAAAASKQVQKDQEKSKVTKTNRSSFASMMEKSAEMESLASAGLPPELAGLDTEQALVFLKDQIDMAADKLDDGFNMESFAAFRKSVSHLLKYVEKNNYKVEEFRRIKRKITVRKPPFFEELRDRDPFFQIHVIDERMNQLASMILQNHSDKLSMLAKVDEIKGMIVDFFAV